MVFMATQTSCTFSSRFQLFWLYFYENFTENLSFKCMWDDSKLIAIILFVFNYLLLLLLIAFNELSRSDAKNCSSEKDNFKFILFCIEYQYTPIMVSPMSMYYSN